MQFWTYVFNSNSKKKDVSTLYKKHKEHVFLSARKKSQITSSQYNVENKDYYYIFLLLQRTSKKFLI